MSDMQSDSADTALRREVAELSGWRVSYEESDDLGDWYHLVDPGGNIRAVTRAPDDDIAWDEMIHELPDWPGDPTAALALMAGDRLEWCSNTVARDFRLWVQHVCSSAWENPRAEGRAKVEVLGGDHAHALARAVTKAWVQWKRRMQQETTP